MEIIAKKSKSSIALTISMLILGLVFFGTGILLTILFADGDGFSTENIKTLILNCCNLIVIYLCGIITLATTISSLIKSFVLPKNLIVYDNGKLIFAGGYTCLPKDVKNVEYNCARPHSRHVPSVTQSYGSITVYTQNRKIKFNNVDDVQNAHNRIIFLMQQSFSNGTK